MTKVTNQNAMLVRGHLTGVEVRSREHFQDNFLCLKEVRGASVKGRKVKGIKGWKGENEESKLNGAG